MSPDLRFSLAPIVLVLCLATGRRAHSTGPRAASGAPGPATWGHPLRPADQIDADNFADLEVAWRFNTDNFGPGPDFNLQSTPLMVDGVLYSTAGSRRSVVAIDAGTGELLWMYRLDEGERAARSVRRGSGRGVGYWTDGAGDERIYFVTIGYQLVALDARTGHPIRTSGNDGIVDLKQHNDQILTPPPSWPGGSTGRGQGHCPGWSIEPARTTYPRAVVTPKGSARVRCPHRRTAVDLPHDPATG